MAGNGRLRVDVEIQGYRDLLRKLQPEPLLAQPWTEAMRTVARMAERSWQMAAPVASGRERRSIRSKVQAKPIPRWALVKATATRTSAKYKRYRYPNRQEYDRNSPNYQKLTIALMELMNIVQSVLDNAADRIESKWRS